VYCSNHVSTTGGVNYTGPAVSAPIAALVQGEDDLLNQQSNSNEQSVIIRTVPNNMEGVEVDSSNPSSSNTHVDSNYLIERSVKINSNIQSNVNKQLQPTISKNEMISEINLQHTFWIFFCKDWLLNLPCRVNPGALERCGEYLVGY